MNEYPIPGFKDYFVTEDGAVISYRTKKRKVIAGADISKGSRYRRRISLATSKGQVKINLHRLVAMAKYQRELLPCEDVRHCDGNPSNNHMNNISVGDRINNIIDELVLGRLTTTPEYIDLAIARLTALA